MIEEAIKKYNPVPTLKLFHESMAPIRCVVGPVGSSKTSGAVMEMCYYMPQFLYKEYGIKRTKWVVVRNCYDDKTEILTETRGWRLFRDLLPTDKVAMLQDNKTVFTKPSYYYSADYVGQMIGFENEGLDFLVTPDHKLSVSLRNARKNNWSPYRLRLASECYGKTNMKVRRCAGWDGIDPGLSPEMFEWLGYWFAEGSTTVKSYNGSVRHNCIIITKTGLQYTHSVFQAAGLPYTTNKRQDGSYSFRLSVTTQTKPLILKLASCGKAISKGIPSDWKNAPVEHLQRFIKGYLAGDGSHRRNDTTICAITSSLQLADDIQEIGLRAGYVVNLNDTATKRECMVINGIATKQTRAPITLTFLNSKKYSPHLTAFGRYRGWYKESYSGKVYCVEVPSHIVYVRRNGRAFWCSQTYRELVDTTVKSIQDPMVGWFPNGVENKGDNEYTIKYENGVEVTLLYRSCDRPQDVKKFKSLEIYGYLIDESIEVSEETKRMLKNRIGRFPSYAVWAKALREKIPEFKEHDDDKIREEIEKDPDRFMTRAGIEVTNPPDAEHPTYSEFNWQTPPPGPIPKGTPKKGHIGFWQPPRENEKNLRPGYYEDLINDYSDAPDWIETYVEGKPGMMIAGKLVYNNFKRSDHVASSNLIWSKGTILRGWDNSGNRPACVIIQIPRPFHVQILKEFITDKMGIIDFCEWVKVECNLLYPNATYIDWADPAGENEYSKKEGGFTSNAKLMRDECKIDTMPSEQNWEVRKESVDQQLARRDGMLIDPSCTRLINGFVGGYCYPKIGTTDSYRDQPVKNKYADIQDALQYVMVQINKGNLKRGHTPKVTTDFRVI